MTISELIKQAHGNAKEKGWWDKEPSFGELIALCHTELSEALEDYRNGNPLDNVFCDPLNDSLRGVPVELADVIIRIADLCGRYGIDLEAAIEEKMEYNRTRPYRHGGKVI